MRFCGFCGFCVSAFLRFCGVRDRDRVFDRRYTDIPKYDSCRFNQQPNRSIRTPVRIAEQGLKHRSCQAAIHICRCMIHASRSCPACIHVPVPMHVLRTEVPYQSSDCLQVLVCIVMTTPLSHSMPVADLRDHKHGQNEPQRYRGSGRPSMVTTDDDSSFVKKQTHR